MSEVALKRLVGALALVVALWAVASLVSRGGGSIDAPTELGGIFDGVDATSVTAVRFVRPDDTIELVPGGDGWRVNGFRADSGNVARFFESVADAEVGDLMATNPANHGRMGVSSDSANVLEIDAGGDVRSVLVGSTGPRFSTVYARLPGADEVYLLEGGLRTHVTRDLDAWRNRRMTAIDTGLVTRIDVERDGDSFTVIRADTAWTFEDGGAAETRQIQSLLQELGGSLVAAGFVADEDSIAALPAAGETVAYSESGEVLAEVRIGSGTGERWATVAGDSVRYRIASFRANLIAPTLESVTPD